MSIRKKYWSNIMQPLSYITFEPSTDIPLSVGTDRKRNCSDSGIAPTASGIAAELLLLPEEYSQIIFTSSFLFGVTAIYAYAKKRYDISILLIIMLIASLNYWRDPRRGVRRNIDRVLSITAFIYIFAHAIVLQNISILSYIFCLIGIISYLVGWYVRHKGHIFLSTLCHCTLHICANLAILFSI